jgi:hypothetical protein
VTWIELFAWGCFGSLAVEVVDILKALQQSILLPGRYRRWLYWVVRLCIVCIAGGLVVATGSSTPIQAITIGAAAPLFFEKITERDGPAWRLGGHSNGGSARR